MMIEQYREVVKQMKLSEGHLNAALERLRNGYFEESKIHCELALKEMPKFDKSVWKDAKIS